MTGHEQAAHRLTSVAQLAYQLGLARTGGNFSVRIGGEMLISPTGGAADYLGRLLPEQLCSVELVSGAIASGPPASRETDVHLLIYRRYPSMGGIVHAHPPMLLGFSANPAQLRPATQSAHKFTAFRVCPGGPLKEPIARTVSRVLDATTDAAVLDDPYGLCVFLPGHGVFMASTTIERAFYFLNKVEENARTVLLENLMAGSARGLAAIG